ALLQKSHAREVLFNSLEVLVVLALKVWLKVLIVLGKLKFPLPCKPCAIIAMLSAMISSSYTSSPLIMECIRMALAMVISDLFPVGTRECMMNTDAVFSRTLDLGKYTESYQVIYHNEVDYRSHED
ncbi:hypothetical protein PIB30_077171, partial [Stylosanthes scabra]|nr:hypothetical protein [Stylosanthes scabra]